MALLGRTLLRQPRGLHQRPPAAAAGHLQPAASAARSAACASSLCQKSSLLAWLRSCAQVDISVSLIGHLDRALATIATRGALAPRVPLWPAQSRADTLTLAQVSRIV